MNTLKLHTIESAPEASKPFLEKSLKQNGYLPNLHAALAGAPGLIEAYQMIHGLFLKSSFNKDEITVVWQTINVEHECNYCVPAHTAIAKSMKVEDEITKALRNQTALPTDKLQVLHELTLSIVRNRGFADEDKLEKFYQMGYSQQQLLEIILGLSQKVISNYTNHMAETPLDDNFKPFAWSKQKA